MCKYIYIHCYYTYTIKYICNCCTGYTAVGGKTWDISRIIKYSLHFYACGLYLSWKDALLGKVQGNKHRAVKIVIINAFKNPCTCRVVYVPCKVRGISTKRLTAVT